MKKICVCIVISLTMIAYRAEAQGQKPANDVVAGIPVNYDESKVGTYTLPDPLLMANGRKVKNAKQWIFITKKSSKSFRVCTHAPSYYNGLFRSIDGVYYHSSIHYCCGIR